MELDKNELRLGKIWFFSAGTCAICLAFFLAFTDLRLTYSDSEEKKGELIKEIRMAQSSLVGSSVDPRLKRDMPAKVVEDDDSHH